MQSRTGQFVEAAKHFFVKDTKQPYDEDEAVHLDPGRPGRRASLIWGRQVYRWSDLDFEANMRDGTASIGRSATRTSRRGTATSRSTSA